MRVEVKNNNVSKAISLLNKKLKRDGIMQLLKERRFFRSKAQKARDKHKYALIRLAKDQKLKEEAYEKYEQRIIIENKKLSKKRRQEQADKIS